MPTPGDAHPVEVVRPPVSVVILTFNEEVNIAACINSCKPWFDDIHVLDSGSADRTVEISRELGATVHFNKFESFGQQRNWAIDHVPCKYPWHFHLDADERFTPELVREIAEELGPDGTRSKHDAYLSPSKLIFLGRWIKRSGGYPGYQVRLFRYGRCRFIDFGHGQREQCEGSIVPLRQPYIHLGFSKGLVEWFGKHNQYSSREAGEGVAVRGTTRIPLRSLFSRDAVARRRAFKNLSFFLRARALWRFLYSYFIKLGFVDGWAGFHYCAMISMYEYWIEIKIRERESDWFGDTTRLAEKLGARA
jgi:glycosyltransferase involved in cell wall biosynthesis